MQIIVGPYGMQSPHPYRRPHVELYEELVELAVRAEELGYDGIALTEHSFWYDGYCPSLLPALAAVAQHTKRIKLMTAALLLPQHDPLKVAEEAAVVDRLSGGRLILGLGVGYRPEEFLGHGVPEGRWGARLIEAYEVIELALSRERFSYEGEFYRYENVSLATRPLQDPVPMWVCAGYQGWAPRASGRRGWAFCTTGDLVPGVSVFDLYAESASKAGVEPSALRRGLFGDVMVMPSALEARALGEEDYWPAFNDQFLGFGFMDFRNPDGSQMTELPEAMKEGTLGRNPLGTPDVVRERLQTVVDMDLDLFLVRMSWANAKHERALRSLETFARDVMPIFRQREEQE